MNRSLIVLAGLLLDACNGHGHRTNLPDAPPSTTSAIHRVTPGMAMSEEVLVKCNIHAADTRHSPRYEFDRSELQPADRDVLAKVAECLTTGPLKGRSLTLVGRADPRGEAQYNMALGAQRAGGVAEYLAQLGLSRSRLEVTSRGDLDSLGVDEDGWATDRRVDILLGR